MERSLKGKNVLVTGAGAGIGLACAEAFVAAGANVAICDVEQARLDAALATLAALGGNHYGQLCDVANAEAVADFFRNSQSALGSLDITLNNAGVGSPLVPLAETDEADYDRLMVLRAASNYTTPPPGVTPADNLLSERSSGYSGLLGAVESLYLVGNTVLEALLADWPKHAVAPPSVD